ncbi:hypothetical protein [Deinococcus sp. QL22]|uniref:hypothetical protein n=1 Tax=Deinococcus sp. QL22 TaxID=2939437 RepID=UPI00201808C9|nr:hypothetical protein [Deinococcus sp. QL22]UQN09380.1 hypothetical protein M1R55_22750 [Deinococcus sp. QL22]
MKPLTRWQPSIFELLVTVGALAELLRPTSAVPMIEDRAALTKVLSDLGRFTVLSTARVDHTLNQIQVALGADGQRLLVSGRLRREQQVAQILARSRLVRTEDAPSPEFFRLAFQVPGGQATVAAVQLSPAVNPFLQGLPSSTLQTVLKRLNEQ